MSLHTRTERAGPVAFAVTWSLLLAGCVLFWLVVGAWVLGGAS